MRERERERKREREKERERERERERETEREREADIKVECLPLVRGFDMNVVIYFVLDIISLKRRQSDLEGWKT